MSTEGSEDKITLEDVETAISILQHFVRKMQRAQMVIRQVESIVRQSSYRGFGGGGMANLGFEDVLNIAWEIERRKMQAKGELPSESSEKVDEGVLSPEEVAKMKELVRKYKSSGK